MQHYGTYEVIRTFTFRLNKKYARGALYSHNPKDIETLYAIASTICYDNVN